MLLVLYPRRVSLPSCQRACPTASCRPAPTPTPPTPPTSTHVPTHRSEWRQRCAAQTQLRESQSCTHPTTSTNYRTYDGCARHRAAALPATGACGGAAPQTTAGTGARRTPQRRRRHSRTPQAVPTPCHHRMGDRGTGAGGRSRPRTRCHTQLPPPRPRVLRHSGGGGGSALRRRAAAAAAGGTAALRRRGRRVRHCAAQAAAAQRHPPPPPPPHPLRSTSPAAAPPPKHPPHLPARTRTPPT